MDGGDGCIPMYMYLMLLNCPFEMVNGPFVMYETLNKTYKANQQNTVTFQKWKRETK